MSYGMLVLIKVNCELILYFLQFLFQSLSQTQLLRQTLNNMVEEKRSLTISASASLDLVCCRHSLQDLT